jgi:predicted Zn-dependent peptidase
VDGITPEELSDAKNFIEGDFMLHNEDTENLADTIGFYEHVGDAKMMKDYIRNIRKVTISDISRIKKKYLKKDNYTLAIIGQK